MNLPSIIEAACSHYGVTPKDIRGKITQPLFRRARNLAVRMMADIAVLDNPSIAACLNCDRDTVRQILKSKRPARRDRFEREAWEAAGVNQGIEAIVAFPPANASLSSPNRPAVSRDIPESKAVLSEI